MKQGRNIVKYLVEQCHANVEAKDIWNKYTPLIYASNEGHLEVVRYLHEQCHAQITQVAISKAKNEEIGTYLKSKI